MDYNYGNYRKSTLLKASSTGLQSERGHVTTSSAKIHPALLVYLDGRPGALWCTGLSMDAGGGSDSGTSATRIISNVAARPVMTSGHLRIVSPRDLALTPKFVTPSAIGSHSSDLLGREQQ